MPPIINMVKCTGCGICDGVCPGDIIHMEEITKMPVVKYPDECWYCGSCREDCPEDAISYTFPKRILELKYPPNL